MNKKAFGFTVLSYLMLSLADVFLTYKGTPDLNMEGNPLVVIFNCGWNLLIAVNIITFIIYVFAAYYLFIKYKSPKFNLHSFKEYISMLFYNTPDRFSWSWYKLPKNITFYKAILAFIYVFILPVNRLIVVSEWCLHFFSPSFFDSYYNFKSVAPFGRLDLVIAFLLSFLAVQLWLYKQYKNNIIITGA